jgi:ribonuclease HI
MAKAKPKKEAIVYEVHTDGSALGNPGAGGYAAVVRCGDQKVTLSKGYFLTTNNRMEMMAVIATLEEFGPSAKINIYTDSQYTIDGSTRWVKNWRRNDWLTRGGEPVKNKDLWIILNELLRVNKVKFIKVKAHSGIPDNEEADQLAKAAAAVPTTHDTEYSGLS